MRPNWLLKTVYCGAFTCGWTRRHDEKGLRCVTTKAPLFADKTRWKHLHCGDEWRRLWQAQDGHFRLGNARKTSRRSREFPMEANRGARADRKRERRGQLDWPRRGNRPRERQRGTCGVKNGNQDSADRCQGITMLIWILLNMPEDGIKIHE